MAGKMNTTTRKAMRFVDKSRTVRRGEQAPGRNSQPVRIGGAETQFRQVMPVLDATHKGMDKGTP